MRHLLLFLSLLLSITNCTNDSSSTNSTQQSTADSTIVQEDGSTSEEVTQDTLLPIPQQTFIKAFSGTIGGSKPIELVLTNWGDGTYSGTYQYKKMGKTIDFFGDAENTNTFILDEFVGNDKSGQWIGQFEEGSSKMKGIWHSPDGKRQLPFDLVAVPESEPKEWSGTWYMNSIWDGGILIIGNERTDALHFALSFVRSGHLGSIEGKARIEGTKAIFEHIEFEGEQEPCLLTFQLQDAYIKLEQASSNIACGFGFRAHASGQYDKQSIEMKAKLAFGTEQDVFLTQADHDAFKQLVGEEFYDLFAFNMQGYGEFERASNDPANIRAMAGAVVGTNGTNEAIIMHDNKGNLWGATIDFRDYDHPKVHYFTNHKAYKSKMPETIASWQEAFEEFPIQLH